MLVKFMIKFIVMEIFFVKSKLSLPASMHSGLNAYRRWGNFRHEKIYGDHLQQ